MANKVLVWDEHRRSREFSTQTEAATFIGVSQSLLSEFLYGISNTLSGSKWAAREDECDPDLIELYLTEMNALHLKPTNDLFAAFKAGYKYNKNKYLPPRSGDNR